MAEFKKYKHKESGEIVLLKIDRKSKTKYEYMRNHIFETTLDKKEGQCFYLSDFQLKRQYEPLADTAGYTLNELGVQHD